MKTTLDKIIGGCIKKSIGFKAKDYIEDEDAFLFTLTERKKYKVRSSLKKQAIMINDGFLMCFGTDLMISQNCFEEENYCSWPSTYESNKELDERGSEWLAGDSQFGIT